MGRSQRHAGRHRLVTALFPAEGPRRRSDGRIDVTVVYLEMTAPPAASGILPAGFEILRSVRPPVPLYRSLYDAVGRDWLWVERKRLDDGALANIIHDPAVEIWLPRKGGAPAGFAELDFRALPAAVSITYFGLVREFVGAGLGVPFLHRMLERAWAPDPGLVRLNTCNLDHPAALPLYLKAGFTPVEVRKVIFDPRV
jgi:GNAT superfamily N-acetyltransferase